MICLGTAAGFQTIYLMWNPGVAVNIPVIFPDLRVRDIDAARTRDSSANLPAAALLSLHAQPNMVLQLHVWGPAFSLPSIEAQCLATIAFCSLVLPKGAWELVASSDPTVSPTGE